MVAAAAGRRREEEEVVVVGRNALDVLLVVEEEVNWLGEAYPCEDGGSGEHGGGLSGLVAGWMMMMQELELKLIVEFGDRHGRFVRVRVKADALT
jgi:hypothetical protein